MLNESMNQLINYCFWYLGGREYNAKIVRKLSSDSIAPHYLEHNGPVKVILHAITPRMIDDLHTNSLENPDPAFHCTLNLQRTYTIYLITNGASQKETDFQRYNLGSHEGQNPSL